jgi:hypothetical protein
MLDRVIVRWAALGIALTSATQLRIAGLPTGPGEVVVALWMAFFAFCLLRGVRFSYSRAFALLATYWSIGALLLMAGSMVAIALDKRDDLGAGHDAVAFAFVGMLTCMLAVRVGDVSNEQYYLSLARATFFTISAMGLILFAALLMVNNLGPISLWYGGHTRFRGLSENPNQLAMFMLTIPFLGPYLIAKTQRFRQKLAYLLGIIVCLAVGLATGSDGLRVGWIGSAIIVAAWCWSRVLVRGRSRFLYVSHFIVPMVVLILALGLNYVLVTQFNNVSEQIYAKGARGDKGVVLVMHGLEAIAQSPLVGWGPGSYSGMDRPFQNFTAENTLIDWGMSTGMLGMILYLGLLFVCMVHVTRSGSPWLLGVLVAIVSDTLFGYSLRQPLFWLTLVLVLALSEPTARRAASPGVSAAKQCVARSGTRGPYAGDASIPAQATCTVDKNAVSARERARAALAHRR